MPAHNSKPMIQQTYREARYALFKYLADNYGKDSLDSEMDEIERLVVNILTAAKMEAAQATQD